MDDETKSGRLTHQLGRPHAWKGGIAGQPYLETVSLIIANMCQGDRGEVSYGLADLPESTSPLPWVTHPLCTLPQRLSPTTRDGPLFCHKG